MNSVLERVKQGVVAIAIGAIFTMIPFYFETSAMSNQALKTNLEQDKAIEQINSVLHEVELQSAVGDNEIRQINLRLERIESKIDRLIEKEN